MDMGQVSQLLGLGLILMLAFIWLWTTRGQGTSIHTKCPECKSSRHTVCGDLENPCRWCGNDTGKGHIRLG